MGVSGPVLLRLLNHTQPPWHLRSIRVPQEAVTTIAVLHGCKLDNRYQDRKRSPSDSSSH